MDILRKQITSFTFADIVTFCQQGEHEGIQLEYKRDLTTGSVPKSIAAFSNTRGGVIIIGVDENRTTGVPNTWNGIPNAAQNIERIHQWASNVDPLPTYEIHQTDEQNGHAFLLIRVFEGENTPYYVHNNPHLWVRTGNTTTPIDYASPEQTKLLYDKRRKAANLRDVYMQLSSEIWLNSINKAERERKNIIANAIARQDGSANGVTTMQLSPTLQRPWLRMQLQPFSPSRILAKPSEIMARLRDISYRGGGYTPFPDVNMTSIPEGLVYFEWERSEGKIYCQQLYATGLVEQVEDILQDNDGRRKVAIGYVLGKLFVFFQGAKNFYSTFAYQGELIGNVMLGALGEGIIFTPITAARILAAHALMGERTGLLTRYDWSLELDTVVLNSPQHFQAYFIELAKEILWSLGFGEIDEAILTNFLSQNNWLAS